VSTPFEFEGRASVRFPAWNWLLGWLASLPVCSLTNYEGLARSPYPSRYLSNRFFVSSLSCEIFTFSVLSRRGAQLPTVMTELTSSVGSTLESRANRSSMWAISQRGKTDPTNQAKVDDAMSSRLKMDVFSGQGMIVQRVELAMNKARPEQSTRHPHPLDFSMNPRNSEKPSQPDAPCSPLPYDWSLLETASVLFQTKQTEKSKRSLPNTRRESCDLKHF